MKRSATLALLFSLSSAVCLLPAAERARAQALAPETLHEFAGVDGGDGGKPLAPPLAAGDGALHGIASPGLGAESGVAYSLVPDGESGYVYRSVLLPGTPPPGGFLPPGPFKSNVVRATDGRLYASYYLGSGMVGFTADDIENRVTPQPLDVDGDALSYASGINAADGDGNVWVAVAATRGGVSRVDVTTEPAVSTTFEYPEEPHPDDPEATVYRYGAGVSALIYSAAEEAIYGLSYSDGEEIDVPEGETPAGALYRLDPVANDGAGEFARLHTFAVESDGSGPGRTSDGFVSTLIEVDDWLYGTTYGTGDGDTNPPENAYGTVWRIGKADPETFAVVYRFASDGGDAGFNPVGLLALGGDGNLYGTGRASGEAGAGPGTIYRVVLGDVADPDDDRVELVHVFDTNGLGENPQPSGLARLDADGFTLVGVTHAGGATGNGTVFRLDIPRPAEIGVFTATPTAVMNGDDITLEWSVDNAVGCTAQADPAANDWSGDVDATGGSAVVTPAIGTTVYTLVCAGEAGDEVSETVSVTAMLEEDGSGGGGGAMGPAFVVLGLLLAKVARSRRRRDSRSEGRTATLQWMKSQVRVAKDSL